MSGSLGVPSLFLFTGDPTGVDQSIFACPQGSFVFDNTGGTGTIYRKNNSGAANLDYTAFNLAGGAYTVISQNYDAKASERLGVITSLSSITITLPANPQPGDAVEVADASGQANTHNIVVSASRIAGYNGPLLMDINFCQIVLFWMGGTTGWQVIRRA